MLLLLELADEMIDTNRRIAFSVLAIVLAGASGCAFPGQRLLTIEIDRDGLTIFSGNYGVPDSTPVDEMFDVVTKVNLDATNASNKTVSQSEAAGGEAQESLPGQLTLRIKHSGEELALRKISNLEMSQVSEGKYWRVKEISYSD